MIINVNLVSRYIRNCLLCTISVRTEHTMARARVRVCVCVTIGQRKLNHVGIWAEDKFPRGPVRESTF